METIFHQIYQLYKDLALLQTKKKTTKKPTKPILSF